MRLYAISDLHLLSEINQQALAALPAHPEDWLILGGDIGETEELLRLALSILTRRFKHLIWVPGNHDSLFRCFKEMAEIALKSRSSLSIGDRHAR